MIIRFLFYRVARSRHLEVFLDSACSLPSSPPSFPFSGNHSLSPVKILPQSTLMCMSFVCVSHYFNGVFAFPPHSYVFTLQAASEVKFLEQKSDHISSLLEVLHRRSYLLPQTPKYLVSRCSFVTVPTYTDLSCRFLLLFPAPVGDRKKYLEGRIITEDV